MTWSFCDSIDEFLKKRAECLKTNESLNSLTWAAVARAPKETSHQSEYRFLADDGAKSSGAHAFISKSTQHLIMGNMNASQVEELVAFLEAHEAVLQVVEGPREPAQLFVKRWIEATACSKETLLKQGVYEVTQVKMPDSAGGRMRLATQETQEVLAGFVESFRRECFPKEPISLEFVQARIARFLNEKRAYLWQNSDQELVSMAAVVRESPNTSSISFVYTPPNHRGRGYGACIVAALSQAQLDSGKSACNLHTNLENPSSNGVYLRIGYTLIGESLRVRFAPHPANT